MEPKLILLDGCSRINGLKGPTGDIHDLWTWLGAPGVLWSASGAFGALGLFVEDSVGLWEAFRTLRPRFWESLADPCHLATFGTNGEHLLGAQSSF